MNIKFDNVYHLFIIKVNVLMPNKWSYTMNCLTTSRRKQTTDA
jgi:hypothetical protein